MRPVLKPALRRLWRDHSTLQIGLDPDRALVLAGCDDETVRLLDTLDGRREPTPREKAPAREPSGHSLVDLLMRAGVLDDAGASTAPVPGLDRTHRERLGPDMASQSMLSGAPDGGVGDLARRRAGTVEVLGAGRVGAGIALLLAAAGTGRIDVRDPGLTRAADCAPGGLRVSDIGRRREVAVRELLAEYPAQQHRDGPPSAVVLTGRAGVDVSLRAKLRRARIPHLLATVRETTGLVGAFALPGRSACLRCLDLHRADRDPAWPVLVAQLADDPMPRVEACDTVLATAVASCATREVLALLDGRTAPATVDGTLELCLPDWRWRRRSWSPHPDCDCLDD